MNTTSYTRIITGGIIILFGILALLGSLDVINFAQLWNNWWPLLLIVGGVLLFINDRREYVWPVILVVLGVLWQIDLLYNSIDINIWQIFWPLVIIAIGWSIAMNRSNGDSRTMNGNQQISSILGGVETKSDDQNYTGGKMTTIMGGTVLDLRHARIKKEATIEVFALMGGIELRIPEGWQVKTSVLPVLGGVEDKTVRASQKDAPIIHIVGNVILGGVEVKN